MSYSLSPLTSKVLALEALNKANIAHFLNRDCEPLDTALSCYESRYPKLGKAISELQGQCSLPITKVTTDHIKLVLLNVIKALNAQEPYALAYPSSPTTISKLNSKGKSHKLTATLGKVVDKLAAKGYVTKLSGTGSIYVKQPVEGGGRRYNRLLPTLKMVNDIIEGFDLGNIPLSLNQSSSFVIVTTKREVDEYTQVMDEVPLKRFTREKDNAAIKATNKVLRQYNELLSRTQISLAQGQVAGSYSKKVYRKFCRGSLDFGGRLYGGFWQSLPSGKRGEVPSRKGILVNGQPTIELDFKALHINMLYAREGKQPFNGDPYAVPGWNRELVKRCILVALNCPTNGHRAVLDAVADDAVLKQYRLLLLKGGYENLKQAFIEIHPLLAKYLHADVGIRLQKQDGDIALGVIEHMMHLPAFISPASIPVLSIHDSFICPIQHEQVLRSCMIGAFERVMGSTSAPAIEAVS